MVYRFLVPVCGQFDFDFLLDSKSMFLSCSSCSVSLLPQATLTKDMTLCSLQSGATQTFSFTSKAQKATARCIGLGHYAYLPILYIMILGC